MKLNRMIAIALGMILMTSVYSCDSTDKESGEEPTPVEKDDDSKGGNDDPAENPADNDPADDDDEYVDFVPYTGPIEPLSDDIRPTYTDGKRWVCDRVDESHPKGTGQYEYQIVGDAVINESVLGSLAYLSEAVYMTSAKKATFTNNKPQYYKEENGVAYLLGTTYIDGCTRYVYHPFWEINPSKSKQVADYYSLGIIVSRGTITLMGKVRRAVKLLCPRDIRKLAPYDYWVEGIGPLFGFKASYEPQPNCSYFGESYHIRLRECYDGDEKIYDYREFKHDLYVPEVEFTNEPEDLFSAPFFPG